jgi:gamma-glutamyltranspeptidase/glutathione hydrolase
LAKTLKLIQDNGAKGFYEGETAKLVVEEMQRGKGIMSYDDLKNYICKPRKPVEVDYRGLPGSKHAAIKQRWNYIRRNAEND